MKEIEFFRQSVIKNLHKTLDEMNVQNLANIADVIVGMENRGNRLHMTGIGKPGHLASYGASLLSSTGTPCSFLHGTEAVHGSCGQLVEGDIVICISNSGETAELKATVEAIHRNGCKTIALTGKKDSWLEKKCRWTMLAKIEEEGGPLNRAPRNSILAETVVLQCLSVILQSMKNISPQEYVLRHPGGSLGKIRECEL